MSQELNSQTEMYGYGDQYNQLSQHIDAQNPAEEYIQEMGWPGVAAPQPTDIPPGMGRGLLPHYVTFSSILNFITRTYRWTYDAARKHSDTNAVAIRNDTNIMEALRTRQMPTAQLAWHIEPTNPEDQREVEAASQVTRVVNAIPKFQQYRLHLLEAIWFGRYGVADTFRWNYDTGSKRLLVVDYRPVNGDKLVFKFSGQVGILVHQQYDGTWQITDRGRAHFLTPAEREMLVVHKHEPEDVDFFSGDLAGGIHGVGIRGRVYWLWWLKTQVMTWLMDYLERVGAGGFTIYYYEHGNSQSLTDVQTAAQSQMTNNIILFPRYKQGGTGGPGIERIEPSNAGANLLQALVNSYFDQNIRRYIAGLNISAESTGMTIGTGASELDQQTQGWRTKFDAENLDGTITSELLPVLYKYNCPGVVCGKFKSDVEKPNTEGILEATKAFFEMGGQVDEDELRGLIGLSTPEPGHNVLAKLPPVSPAGVGALPQNVPMLGQPGPLNLNGQGSGLNPGQTISPQNGQSANGRYIFKSRLNGSLLRFERALRFAAIQIDDSFVPSHEDENKDYWMGMHHFGHDPKTGLGNKYGENVYLDIIKRPDTHDVTMFHVVPGHGRSSGPGGFKGSLGQPQNPSHQISSPYERLTAALNLGNYYIKTHKPPTVVFRSVDPNSNKVFGKMAEAIADKHGYHMDVEPEQNGTQKYILTKALDIPTQFAADEGFVDPDTGQLDQQHTRHTSVVSNLVNSLPLDTPTTVGTGRYLNSSQFGPHELRNLPMDQIEWGVNGQGDMRQQSMYDINWDHVKHLQTEIKKHGQLTDPVMVTEKGKNRYSLYDGHHRLLAASQVGLGTVPAWVSLQQFPSAEETFERMNKQQYAAQSQERFNANHYSRDGRYQRGNYVLPSRPPRKHAYGLQPGHFSPVDLGFDEPGPSIQVKQTTPSLGRLQVGKEHLIHASRQEDYETPDYWLYPQEQQALKATGTSNHKEFQTAYNTQRPPLSDYTNAAKAGRLNKDWYDNSAFMVHNLFPSKSDAFTFSALMAATSPHNAVKVNFIKALQIWKAWEYAGRPKEPIQNDMMLHRLDQGLIPGLAEKPRHIKVNGKDVPLAGNPVNTSHRLNTIRALSNHGDPDTQLLPQLSGLKVSNFGPNILGDVRHGTFDVHHSRFEGVPQSAYDRLPQYLASMAKLRAAASKLNEEQSEQVNSWTPPKVQASVWAISRGLTQSWKGKKVNEPGITTWPNFFHRDVHAMGDFYTLLKDPKVREHIKDMGLLDSAQRVEEMLGQRPRPSGALLNKSVGSGLHYDFRPMLARIKNMMLRPKQRYQAHRHLGLVQYAQSGQSADQGTEQANPGDATNKSADAAHSIFVSPNVDENLSFEQAVSRSRSSNQKAFRQMAHDLMSQVGIQGGQTQDAIGDWTDGAENSVVQTIPGDIPSEKVDYLGAWYGLLGNQKAVYTFHSSDTGPDSVYQVQVPETNTMRLRQRLDEAQVPFRTIVPSPTGHLVVVLDKGRSLRNSVAQFARHYNAVVREATGEAHELGSGKTRTESRAQYRQLIRRLEPQIAPGKSPEFPGSNG